MVREKSRSPSKNRSSSAKQRSKHGDGTAKPRPKHPKKPSKPPARPTNPCNPCCCLPLSEGCIFVGVWTMLFAIIELSLFGWQTAMVESKRERLSSVANPFGSYDRDWPDRYTKFYKSPEVIFYNSVFIIQIVHMVLDFFLLCASVMLIWGFHCHVKWLIWPWFFALVANIIASLAYCVIWFANGGRNNRTVPTGMIVTQILFVILNIYCLVVVMMGFRALRAGILRGKKYALSPTATNDGNRAPRQIVIDYGDQVRPYESRIQTAVPDKTFYYDKDGNMYTNGGYQDDGGDAGVPQDQWETQQQHNGDQRGPLDQNVQTQDTNMPEERGGEGNVTFAPNPQYHSQPHGAGLAPPNYETTFPAERGDSLAPSVDLNDFTGGVTYGKYDKELLIPPSDFVPKIALDQLESPIEKKDPNFGDFPIAEFVVSKDDAKRSGSESGFDDGKKKEKHRSKSKSRDKSKSRNRDNNDKDKNRRDESRSRKDRRKDRDRYDRERHRSDSEKRSRNRRSRSRKRDDDRDSRDDYDDRHRNRTSSNSRNRGRHRRSSDYDDRSPERPRRSRSRRGDHRSHSPDRHQSRSNSRDRDRDRGSRPVPFVTGPSSAEELDQIQPPIAPQQGRTSNSSAAPRSNVTPGNFGAMGNGFNGGLNSFQLPQTIIFPAVPTTNGGSPLAHPRNIMINSEIKISLKPKNDGGWDSGVPQGMGALSHVQPTVNREGAHSRMTPET